MHSGSVGGRSRSSYPGRGGMKKLKKCHQRSSGFSSRFSNGSRHGRSHIHKHKKRKYHSSHSRRSSQDKPVLLRLSGNQSF